MGLQSLSFETRPPQFEASGALSLGDNFLEAFYDQGFDSGPFPGGKLSSFL